MGASAPLAFPLLKWEERDWVEQPPLIFFACETGSGSLDAGKPGQGLQGCLDFRSPGGSGRKWLSLGETKALPCPALPSPSSAPGHWPDDILVKGSQPTAPVSCCLKEVVAWGVAGWVGEARPELKAERNNNTSVFQALLYTRCCSQHIPHSVNPPICPLRHLLLSPFTHE